LPRLNSLNQEPGTSLGHEDSLTLKTTQRKRKKTCCVKSFEKSKLASAENKIKLNPAIFHTAANLSLK